MKSDKNICIYKVQKVPVLARCNILLKCFSYDVFMGYINWKAVDIKSKHFCTF